MTVPTQPSFIPQAWASGTGNFDTIPATQQETGRASWDGGFPLENTIPVVQGGVPANYLDFQGVLNALSSFAWWQQRGGQFTWSSDLEYPVGAFVLGSDGKLYKSIQSSSPSDPQDPTTATAYWTIADPTAFFPLSGGTITGLIVSAVASTIVRDVSTSALQFFGGDTSSNGAGQWLYGKDYASYPGAFRLRANNGTNNVDLLGKPDGTFTWNGQTIQTSSDERLKTAFSDVPDEVLDAWGKVNWQQFKFIADAERKGLENCRWHPGLVAQRVKTVFEVEGLDACKYGILCHDEWQDEYEDVEIIDTPESKDNEGNVVPAVTHTENRLVREAGDLWTIRYEEALAMEAAYQRRRADRLEERIARLEALLEGDLK